jgi:hypothetical protein
VVNLAGTGLFGGTYGDRVIEWLENESRHKLKLEVSPNSIGTQRKTKYWTFVV